MTTDSVEPVLRRRCHGRSRSSPSIPSLTVINCDATGSAVDKLAVNQHGDTSRVFPRHDPSILGQSIHGTLTFLNGDRGVARAAAAAVGPTMPQGGMLRSKRPESLSFAPAVRDTMLSARDERFEDDADVFAGFRNRLLSAYHEFHPLEDDGPGSTVEGGILPSTPLDEEQMVLEEAELRELQRYCLNRVPDESLTTPDLDAIISLGPTAALVAVEDDGSVGRRELSFICEPMAKTHSQPSSTTPALGASTDFLGPGPTVVDASSRSLATTDPLCGTQVDDDGKPKADAQPQSQYHMPTLSDLYYVVEQFEEFASSMWRAMQSWKVVEFRHLPQWLQDNDYLHFGHRPPLSTAESFKSIMRIHTETGNIWTHLLTVVGFIALSVFLMIQPSSVVGFEEKMVFIVYFTGAILCFGMSFLFHVLCSHRSLLVCRFFNKLDYCGISFLTIGSYVAWLYYAFYCRIFLFYVYVGVCVNLGLITAAVTTMPAFEGPRFRWLRATLFVAFGVFGAVPTAHYFFAVGWRKVLLEDSAFLFFLLSAVCYISGAVVYALRVPERFLPGKVDIWFHSHQIFHCLVTCGAFVFYHSISLHSATRAAIGPCPANTTVQLACIDRYILSAEQQV